MKHNLIYPTNISPYFQEGSDLKTVNKTTRTITSCRWSFLMIACFLMMLLNTNLSLGQILSNNDFNFAGTLTTNGWTAHSGAGTNALSTTTGLTYAGLPGSGVGNATLVNNLGGEDANITFVNQNTDGQSIYFSCMVNVTEAGTKSGDYFLHIGTPGGATFTLFAARVFAKVNAGVVNFGLSNTSTATYGTTNFTTNTTYFLIVKYTINVAGNDATSLWVVTSGVPATEVAAGAAEVVNTTTAGQNAINTVALRQGSSTNSVQTVVDGIVVGNTWNDVAPGLDEATLSNISPQPSGAILQGNNDVVLAGFTVASALSKDFTQVTVTGGGSATSADINTVRIFRDNDGNGAINGADASVSGLGDPFAASMVFNITGETGVTSARTYLIVANVDVAADVSRNVSVSVAPGAFVTTSVSNVGSATGNVREIDALASPLITLSAGALTPFTTLVGTPSAQQSYTVEGSNLSANVDITPPADFKIRIDANAFSSGTISLTPAQVVAPGKTIDVVYDPISAGSHSGDITHISTGAATQNKAVSGSSLAAEPTTQATVTFGAVTSNSIVINFSGGDGSARVVVVRDLSAVSYTPTDGVASVSVNSLYFSLANPNGNKIVYDGSGNTVTVTGLDQLKAYHVAVYEYNGSGAGANYLTTLPGINNTTTSAKVIVPVLMSSQIGLTYTENFNDEANWGDGFNFGIGTEPWGGIDVTVAGAIPDGVNTTRSTLSFVTTSTSGGVQRGTLTGSANVPGSIVLLSTGNTAPSNACAIDFHLNFTGVSAGTLSFNWESVFNSAGDRPSFLRIFTSTDGVTFTELPGAAVLNIPNGPPISGSILSIVLPPSFNNVADATIRFYEYNGIAGQNGSTGSRAKISIKDVTVSAGVPPTKLVVTNINPASPIQNAAFSVTVQAQDAGNNPQNVLTNTDVSLTLIIGGGSLTGTLTGTILAGTNNVIITGVLYNLVENGIVVEASRTAGDVLTSGNSSPFNVIAPVPTITLTGTLLPFLIGVGGESAPQSYTVKGEYLLADIVVTPPANFKIRIDANPFSSGSINLTPAQVVTPKTIDVVYAPGAVGPHIGDITHTSTSAITQNEAVSGNTNAAEPTTSSVVTMGCSTNGSIIVNFTGGDGSSRIVVASANNLATFTPADGFPSAPVVSSDFSAATDQGGGDKIVYDGSGSTVTVTGLSSSTTYYFRVYEYNGSGALTEYLTSTIGSGSNATLGPISYSTTGSTYLQDFDGLPVSGSFSFVGVGPVLVSACPIGATNASGWQFGKAAGTSNPSNAVFLVDNGGAGSGSAYSFGTTANTDRAFGSAASGGVTPALGTAIVNNTPDILRTITISYTGEQWRNGGSGAANVLTFSYSLDGTDIFTGTYTPEPTLNFSSPVIAALGSGVALDGDAALNRAVVTATFTLNANWSPGQTLILKWADNNDAGTDDGLAIDDFSFSATVPVTPTVQDHDFDFPVVTTVSIKAKWINGDGSGHLVKIKQDGVGPAMTNPIDGTDYPASAAWANSGEQVVYNGTADSVEVTGLTAGTLYEFRVFGYNGSALSSKYLTITANLNPALIFTEFPTPPTKLAILSVNGGTNPTVNQPFSVVVQSQDVSSNPQNVNINTDVELSVTNGFGNLTATMSGTILAGQNSVTITGVILDLAENNVELTATRTAGFTPLDPGVSSPFNVLDVATQLSFFTVPTTGIAGVALGTIEVRAVRPDNTVDAGYSGNITLGVNTGPGIISGTLLTQPTVLGVATFTNVTNNIQLNVPGPYTLSATSVPLLTSAVSPTINITGTPVMTELVVPKFMGSKSAGSTNTNRTPIAVCLRIDNLVPQTTYDLRAGFDLVGAAATFYGAGNAWLGSGSSYSPSGGTTIQNVFTTDLNGSSGPFWIYMQPTGNASRFGGGQVHNIRIGYVIDGAGNPPSSPNFIGTETITTLDIAATALTVTSGDDGAFLTGVAASCAAEKYILVYDNVAGTGRPLFSFQSRQAAPIDTTNANYSGFLSVPAASIMKDLYMQNGSSVVGQWPAVIPIGANNPNGVQRIEARNANNTIFGAETEASGIWPGGANTTTITKRGVATLLPSDAPISILVSNLNPSTGCEGTAIVITGSHFTGATNVSFNGTSDPTFSVFSDTEIHATVPVGATTGIVTVTSSTGCVGSGPSFTIAPCNATLTSNILLQGFYLGGGTMTPEMNNVGVDPNPLVVDVVTINAMDAGYPGGPNGTSPVDAQVCTLYVDGSVSATFGAAVVPGTAYYLRVQHRNSLEVWTPTAIVLGATNTYLFSSGVSQALNSSQASSGDGFALLYAGDINQDLSIDASDFLLMDPEIQAGLFGYYLGDLTGEGSVDASDFLALDPNIQLGITGGTP